MKTARTLRPKAGDRLERFCEYCNEVEVTEMQINKFQRNIVKLTAQPDGTITCSECGEKHNYKHQNPTPPTRNTPTPIQIANQQRREEAQAQRNPFIGINRDELRAQLDALGV